LLFFCTIGFNETDTFQVHFNTDVSNLSYTRKRLDAQDN